MWLSYLVYSLSNCAIKLCIETSLSYLLRMAVSLDVAPYHALLLNGMQQLPNVFSHSMHVEMHSWSII
jgi:hypothetical protein